MVFTIFPFFLLSHIEKSLKVAENLVYGDKINLMCLCGFFKYM